MSKKSAEIIARIEEELQRAKDDSEMATEQDWVDYHDGEAEALGWVVSYLSRELLGVVS